MKVFFRMFFFFLLVLIAILLFNTLTFKSKQIKGVKAIDRLEIPDQALSNFQSFIQSPSISYPDRIDTLAFINQDSLLKKFYPLVNRRLERQTHNGFSLVYKWKGKDPDLKPILLLAHLDVVPIEAKDSIHWRKPPFSAEIDNGYIYGRGTLDDKMSVIAPLEAINMLLEEEFMPARDIYLAFGHDEEVGGTGAQSMAAAFQKAGIEFEFILDEGLVILKDALGGLSQPLAMIGIAEKGYTSLKLEIKLKEGGHSSMPGSTTAIGNLSRAIHKLNEEQFPAKINGATAGLLDAAGPEMSFLYKALFANLWLTKGLIKSQLTSDATSASLVRTTTAPTIIEGGIKDNVMPSNASAHMNFRILPGETIETVIDRVKDVIDDPLINVEVDLERSSNPSKVSSTESFGFRVIQKTTQEVFPDVIISPGLVIAATDSRHYAAVSNNIYRFSPLVLDRDDLKGIHGNNEKISIENFENSIRFFRRLIENSSM